MAKSGLISIGLCADTHYWPNAQDFVTPDGSLQLQGASNLILQTLLEELNDADLDLVIHLGDMTCGGGSYAMPPDVFVDTMSVLYQSCRELNAPLYVLPGNHDSTPGVGGWQAFHAIWGAEAGRGATIDLPGVRLVLLNTQGHSFAQIADAQEFDPVYGWVSHRELARLDEALSTADERAVLVFTHQPLLPWSGSDGWQEFYGVQNADAALRILSHRANVTAVFQAHAHRFDVRTVPLGDRNCTFVIAPSLIEYPVAWVRLDISHVDMRIRLQRLPLSDLPRASRNSGAGQSWRAGQAAWWDFVIPLHQPL